MSNNMLSMVSIIIPIYNAEKFIKEAILSVLNQSYPHIELILIDDGSTDNSNKICAEFVDNPKVKLITQTNKGVSVARNKGISTAQGEFIYCMDADDTIDKEFIQSSVDVAMKSDADITIVGEYYRSRLPYPTALPTCAMFLKKSFLDENEDIRYPEGIQPCEDGLFSHQLLALTEKIDFNPHGIYHYRNHENQNHRNVNKNIEKILNQIPIWLEILEQFYSKYNLHADKYLHLSRFILHEPLGFRYLKMNFNDNQKNILFERIKNFTKKNIIPYLKNEDKKSINPLFIKFIESKDYKEFDRYYQAFFSNIQRKRKRNIFLTKIIYFWGKQKRKEKIAAINNFFDKELEL